MSVFHKLYTEKLDKYKEHSGVVYELEKFDFFLIYLTSLISSFSWIKTPVEKMPLFMPENFIQQSGRIGLFKNGNEFKLLPIFPDGNVTEYGEYTDYIAVDCTAKTYQLKADDVCICYNNSFKIPYYSMVKRFADKSAFALRSVDVGLAKAIAPTVLGCSSPEQMEIIGDITSSLTNPTPYKGMLKSKFDNKEIERMSAFDNRENDILALWDVYVRYRNLYYGIIGINNVEITKKERLTEAESAGNDEIVRYSLFDDMWRCRKDFKKRAKEKFNVDVEIEINRDAETVFGLEVDNDEKIETVIDNDDNNSEKVPENSDTDIKED